MKTDRITGTLHEDQYTFFIIPRSVLLRMRNTSEKIRRVPENTRFMFNNFSFFENHAFYETMWKHIVEPDTPPMTIWRMRFTCWIPKATNTHSEYVILIAFPLRRWFTNALHCYVIRTLPNCYV